MRCHIVATVVLSGASLLHGQPKHESRSDGVARLITQLGDPHFAKREAASKALGSLGQPALPALRNAVASSDDLEIQQRAGRIVRAISSRIGEKELAKWEGTWMTAERVYLKFSAGRFSSGTPTYGPGSGTITIVEVGTKVTFADLHNDEGPLKGSTALAIFRRDGETLHACWTYTMIRPTEFKNEGNNYCFTFKRVKK